MIVLLGVRCLTCNTKRVLGTAADVWEHARVGQTCATGCVVRMMRGETNQPREFRLEWKRLSRGGPNADVSSVSRL